MPDPIVYVDRFTVGEGKLEELRRYCVRMAKLVEEQEPGTIACNYFVDEEGSAGTAVLVFENAGALDAHLDVASHLFQEGASLLDSSDIELLGSASDQAQQLTKNFGGAIKSKVLAGFARATR